MGGGSATTGDGTPDATLRDGGCVAGRSASEIDPIMMRRPFVQVLAATAAWMAMANAAASAATGIVVSDFRVQVAALAPGAAPGVSFSSTVGSTAQSDSAFGLPSAAARESFASGLPFGAAQACTPDNPFAGAAATISGDAFGAGAVVQTSAHASSQEPQSFGQATIGLVDDVSTASFTLAPWTVMTISADVQAWASSTGATAFEEADSGVLMAIGDSQGTGPQFAWVNDDAFAFGLLGAVDDHESFVVSLRYANASDAAISGLFSGYVSSYASSDLPVSPVSEPGPVAMSLAGLLFLITMARARRRQ